MTGDSLTTAPALLALLVLVAVVTVVMALVTDDRDPSIVLAWLFVIVLVPVLGVVAYFFLGRNHRERARRRATWRTAVQEPTRDRLEPQPAARRAGSEAAVDGHASPAHRIEATALYEGGTVPLASTSVRLYFTGAEKFRDLFADLRGARQSIHLMYLIWERDELTAEITEILLERMAAGVRVYLMYDWLSSLPYRKGELRALARAGATVVPCYRHLSQVNYRNHMKIAVVDRRVVYSGGMNMGQEYVDGGPRFGVWRDTHYRLTGPVVAAYLSLFGSVWMLDGHGALPDTTFPEAEAEGIAGECVPVQVLHSSVSTRFPAIRDVFLVALGTARSRVWILSYALPSRVSTYEKSGQLDEADAAQRRAEKLLVDAYGTDHPNVARVRNNRATLLIRRGEFEAARALLAEVVASKEKLLGADHPDLAGSLSNLGMSLVHLGRPADAKPYLVRARTLAEQAYGPDHPAVALAVSMLADAHAMLGEFDQVIPLLEGALAVQEKTVGAESRHAAQTLQGLVQARLQAGDVAGARKDIDRARAIVAKLGNENDPEAALNEQLLGMVLVAEGKRAEAERVLRRAVELAEKTWSPDDPRLADSRAALADFLKRK